jgi:hypothetical protein
MHMPSTRALCAMAFDHGEEFDPGQLPAPSLLEELALAASARPIMPGPSYSERRRRRERRARHALASVPEWFSAEDLLIAPWESVHAEPV